MDKLYHWRDEEECYHITEQVGKDILCSSRRKDNDELHVIPYKVSNATVHATKFLISIAELYGLRNSKLHFSENKPFPRTVSYQFETADS